MFGIRALTVEQEQALWEMHQEFGIKLRLHYKSFNSINSKERNQEILQNTPYPKSPFLIYKSNDLLKRNKLFIH